MATNRIIIFILMHSVMHGSHHNSSSKEIYFNGGSAALSTRSTKTDSSRFSNASFGSDNLSPLTVAILNKINARNSEAIRGEDSNPTPLFDVE